MSFSVPARLLQIEILGSVVHLKILNSPPSFGNSKALLQRCETAILSMTSTHKIGIISTSKLYSVLKSTMDFSSVRFIYQ